MAFSSTRSIMQPLYRTLISRSLPARTTTSLLRALPPPSLDLRSIINWSPFWPSSCILLTRHFNSLTDTRYPKRRPQDKPRRKRASLKPSGPYAWVQYTPGQPISSNNPNEGSVKRRNEKKRLKQHHAFIKAEAKKRKVQMQEAKRRKKDEMMNRKMAAVARERAWAERLAELQRLENEKRESTA